MSSVYTDIISFVRIFVKKAEEEVTQVTSVKPMGAHQPMDFDPMSNLDQYTKDIYSKNFNIETLLSLDENDSEDYNKIIYYIEALTNPGDFDIDILRKLGDKAAYVYVNRLLRPVTSGKDEGRGTGRVVYEFGDGKVLKFAYNQAGMYQNTMESRIASRSSYFADVLDIGPRNKWIISERITPFEEGEFSVVTGIPEALTAESSKISKMTDDIFRQLVTRYDLEDDAAEFLKDIFNIRKSFGTIMGDIINPEHWGRSSDGSVKLYDYGMDSSSYSKFYDELGTTKQAPTPEEARELLKFINDREHVPEEHKNLGVVELASLYNNLIKIGK